ncbi:hypothetical protein BDZ91DRAFT_849850 [Kalaharituber pfeilii]|nr:hypothetical protein BDZ91DRAFT_849850 [Kalaharituber pfeilii]
MPSSYDSSGHGGNSTGNGIGIPQLAACLLIGYLFFRWYSSSPSSTPSNVGSSTIAAASQRLAPVDMARIQQRAEIVHGMFPQIPLSAIRWELQRNGGSIEITTEKILANGFLPEPPASATPAPSTSSASTSSPAPRSRVSTPATGAAASSSSSSSAAKPAAYTDLITRYNLAHKLNTPEPEEESSSSGKAPAWSQNKAERQALLQKRREDMILKARRKMEEKERQEMEQEAAEDAAIPSSSPS